MHALTELNFLSQTLAAVFQVNAQKHLIRKVLLRLSQARVQLKNMSGK